MPSYIIIIFVILGLFSEFSVAEVLIIDRIKQEKNFTIPTRGMSMQQVISEFGEPEVKKAPIGEPPISIWKYQKFSVYFERNWVIDSVIYKASPEEKKPKP